MTLLAPLDKSRYLHEHDRPEDVRLVRLKSEIDSRNLTDMWEMMLAIDFKVSDARDLPRETRNQFCDIISLLLKAFSR